MFDYVRKDLFERLQTGTHHAESARRAMQTCFDIADQATAQRRDISLDHTISGSERKRKLDELTSGALAQRIEEAWKPFAPIQDAIQANRKATPWNPNLSPEDRAALDNIGLVQTAMYFAKRGLNGR